MLASTGIIRAIVATWTAEGLAGTVPLIVDPVCASNVGEPLLHPSALDAMRHELIPMATLVTPNLDEVRLLVGIDVTDDDSQRDAARALHALGPQWALVKGGHLRTSRISPTSCSTAPTSISSRPRGSTPATTMAPGTRSRRRSPSHSPTAIPFPMRSRSVSAG